MIKVANAAYYNSIKHPYINTQFCMLTTVV